MSLEVRPLAAALGAEILSVDLRKLSTEDEAAIHAAFLEHHVLAIRAQVPLAEVANYNSSLSSISAGQGSYTMELSHYDPVPGNVQQQIIDKAQKEKQEAAAAK